MSTVNDETIYHLTPRGWEAGHEPDDRVESWRRSVSAGHVSWRCIWVNMETALDDRDALRLKHRAFMV